MMEIDPLTSLAFSMQANKGVYCLLVGSGVSRSSGIPTGWEVTLELIKRAAEATGSTCEPSPEEWYREKYNKTPSYSEILGKIAKSQADRQAILRSYFEPTEDEKKHNLKTPQKAHKAIAQLVRNG